MHNVPPGSETHFKVVVVSDKFDNLPLIKVWFVVCLHWSTYIRHSYCCDIWPKSNKLPLPFGAIFNFSIEFNLFNIHHGYNCNPWTSYIGLVPNGLKMVQNNSTLTIKFH
jgi:hypothetical protein